MTEKNNNFNSQSSPKKCFACNTLFNTMYEYINHQCNAYDNIDSSNDDDIPMSNNSNDSSIVNDIFMKTQLSGGSGSKKSKKSKSKKSSQSSSDKPLFDEVSIEHEDEDEGENELETLGDVALRLIGDRQVEEVPVSSFGSQRYLRDEQKEQKEQKEDVQMSDRISSIKNMDRPPTTESHYTQPRYNVVSNVPTSEDSMLAIDVPDLPKEKYPPLQLSQPMELPPESFGISSQQLPPLAEGSPMPLPGLEPSVGPRSILESKEEDEIDFDDEQLEEFKGLEKTESSIDQFPSQREQILSQRESEPEDIDFDVPQDRLDAVFRPGQDIDVEMDDITEDNQLQEEELESEDEHEDSEMPGLVVVRIDTDSNTTNKQRLDRYVENIGRHSTERLVWGNHPRKNEYINRLIKQLKHRFRGRDDILILFNTIANNNDLHTNHITNVHNFHPDNLSRIRQSLNSILTEDRYYLHGSDEQPLDNIRTAIGVRINTTPRLNAVGNGVRQFGANWPTLLNWDFDLSDLGVFNIHQKDMYADDKPCVIEAIVPQLKNFYYQDLITKKDFKHKKMVLLSLVNNQAVNKESLKIIAEMIQCNIEVRRQMRSTLENRTDPLIKPKLKGQMFPTIKLGLLDDHYFRNDIGFEITRYAIKNYHKLALYSLDDWNLIRAESSVDRTTKDGYLRHSEKSIPLLSAYDTFLEVLNTKDLHCALGDDDIDNLSTEVIYDDSDSKKPIVKSGGTKTYYEKNKTYKSKNLSSLYPFASDLIDGYGKQINVEAYFGFKRLLNDDSNINELKDRILEIQQTRYTENHHIGIPMSSIEFQNKFKLKTLLKIPNIYDKLAKVKYNDNNKTDLVHNTPIGLYKQSLEKTLKKLNENIDENGFQIVKYKYQKCGRKNSKSMGIQLESRLIRGLLCKDYYVDVDMVNCHFVIAEHVYRTKYALKTDVLQYYIRHREACIRSIIKLNKNKGLTRSKIKQLYLIALNGGTKEIQTFINKYKTPAHFKKFIKDIVKMHKYILKKDRKKIPKKMKDLTYLSGLLTPVENELLDFAVRKFIDWNVITDYVYTYIYDGFQFFKAHDVTTEFINKSIENLNKEIKKVKDINMEFKVKEIESLVDINTLCTRDEWIYLGFSTGKYVEQMTYENAANMVYNNAKSYVEQLNLCNKYHVCFFDFETDTKYSSGDELFTEHKPYCVSYCLDDEPIKCILGKNCAKKLMKVLPSYTLMIAHNINYDYRFILRTKGVRVVSGNSLIYFNNRFMCGEVEFKDKKFILKDSFTIIPKALKNFPQIFKLKDIRKEAYPYDLYRVNTFEGSNYRIKDALVVLESNKLPEQAAIDKKIFIENIKALNLSNPDGTFDHKKYAEFYCNQDVRILRDGYNTFRNQILEFTKNQFVPLDIDRICSSSSIAERYVFNENIYDNTVVLKNITRDFIQQSIQGGCTRSYKNYMLKTEKNCVLAKDSQKTFVLYKQKNPIQIVDFDACSLYPSAMFEMKSVPTGEPKIAKGDQLDWSWLEVNTSACFMRIKITKVGKSRANPIMSVKIDDRAYFEDRLWVNREVYVSNIKLQDLITFHKIEFEIKSAIYFEKNETTNTKLGDTIKCLYDLRLKYKSEKNPLQEVIKLIMNSVYGKTSLKPQKYNVMFINSTDEYLKLVGEKYAMIHSSYKIRGTDGYLVKTVNDIDTDSNMCYIGSLILDWSKRIMNRVMCLAEDNNILILYQDTDSIHINFDELDKLSKLYKQKYNKELVGKYMGQFHSDFTVPSNLKNKCEKDYEPRSIKTIIVGRKAYFDKVQINSKGDTFEHYRLKGISDSAIKSYCYDNKITIETLYEKLFNGDEIEFDLAATKPIFKMLNTLQVQTLSDFKRKVSFKVRDTNHLYLGTDHIEDEFIKLFITDSASQFPDNVMNNPDNDVVIIDNLDDTIMNDIDSDSDFDNDEDIEMNEFDPMPFTQQSNNSYLNNLQNMIDQYDNVMIDDDSDYFD